MNIKQFSVSGSTLKIIAIISMLIDHTGAAVIRLLRTALPETMPQARAFLFWLYPITRDIGRLAFPIFCFLLVEGFYHTRNVYKYALRLFIFALISEIPYDFALGANLFDRVHQNVYFTLLLGLFVMIGLSATDKLTPRNAVERLLRHILQIVICVLPFFLARWGYTDYRFRGIMLIEVLYGFYHDKKAQAAIGALTISWEDWGPFAFIPIWFYNGKRGLSLKYIFYWFYPVHLVILGFIKLYLKSII